jgi:glycosyltransferase involved in cell wall biosynthesis/SAM-dependent methyltransferase
MDRKRLALVVQRYGEDIVGGSESLCRTVAEMLTSHYPVEVLTTCAKDYVTWKNEYPAGVSTLNGVTVHRFPVDFERGPRFHRVMGEILGGMPLHNYRKYKNLMKETIAHSPIKQQISCLKSQGPYSTKMLEHLSARHQDYALVIFFTYLYPTTFFGSQQVPTAKTVLIPTAHDEAPIHFPVFQKMFARFPAYVFLTPEERRFIEETFDVDDALKMTIGMPVQLKYQPDPLRFRQKYGLDGQFLLCAGRIEPAKGYDDLFRLFRAARSHLPSELRLVLIGERLMEIPEEAGIIYLGYLPEQDKGDAYAAASVLSNPSLNESFSIVTLEAMLCQTPVVVNEKCAVSVGHVRRSNGGLYYSNGYEFIEVLNFLLAESETRKRMGTNGRQYVEQNYSYSKVEQRFLDFVDETIERSNKTWSASSLRRDERKERRSMEYSKVWDKMAKQNAKHSIYATSDEERFEKGGKTDADRMRQWIAPESVVLDVGCGIGRVEKYLAPYCHAIHAVDVSKEMLHQAKEHLSGIENVFFHHTSSTDLSFADNEMFDFSFSLLVLQHMKKEDAYLSLCEIYRTLKEGGRAYIQFPSLFSDVYSELFIEYAKMDDRAVSRVRPYTPDEVRFLLQLVGFTLESQTSDVEIITLVRKV